MYGYNKYIPLNTTEILKRVDEKDIFSIIIKEPIILDKGAYYKAPYRNDNHPDCYFEMHNNILMLSDFGNTEARKTFNCFQFISRCFNVEFSESLAIINRELQLGLGLGDNVGKIKKIINDNVEEVNVKKIFKEKIITLLPRKFGYKDKEFWSKYKISKDKLIRDGVIPISMYRAQNKKEEFFSVRPVDISYAYTKFTDIEGNLLKGKIKIYSPRASKGGKWLTNCNQNDVGALESLPIRGEKLIISKSYKDCRVIRNQGLNSIWFQNEGQIPSKEILTNLAERFDKIIIWFDNDSTGITNSKIVKNYINDIEEDKARSIFIPPRLLLEKVKDPSDLLSVKGQIALDNFIEQKILSHNDL